MLKVEDLLAERALHERQIEAIDALGRLRFATWDLRLREEKKAVASKVVKSKKNRKPKLNAFLGAVGEQAGEQ
jgi:hypothetical protein